MAVKYLAGNRATGTASDRTGLNVYSTKSWVELGRVTLSATDDTMDLTGLDTSDYPYIKVLHHATYTGDTNSTFQCNSDTGNNYCQRNSYSGSSDSNNTSRANFTYADSSVHDSLFAVSDIINIADQEKLIISHQATVASTGAGNAPNRAEQVGKWANTSSTITSVKHTQTGSGSYTSGSEFVVLGAKSSGTNTDKAGFWQELSSDSLSSAGSTLTSSFTAKKYLWCQIHMIKDDAIGVGIEFNTDTGNNYSYRRNDNGGSDSTITSDDEIFIDTLGSAAAGSEWFGNMFIINKSDKEKLCIMEWYLNKTGSGAGNAPHRREQVGKWANTSAQISSIRVTGGDGYSGDFASGSSMKVWGAD